MTKYSNQAFFATNSAWFEPTGFASTIFVDVAKTNGYRPVHYTGVDLKTSRSSLDAEVREDFYDSTLIILFLGIPKEVSDHHDLWALREMKNALQMNKRCLVYTAPGYPSEILRQYGIEAVTKQVDIGPRFRHFCAPIARAPN